jgi:hypothetical protein
MRQRLKWAIVLLATCFAASLHAAEPTWKAGFARAKITPQKPQWMAGFAGRTHPAEGVLHDLWLKVLALEAPDGRRGVIVASDIEGYPRAMYDRICGELNRQRGLQRSELMLTCSHSHSAPVLWQCEPDCYPLDGQQEAIVKEYSLALEKTIVAKVVEALTQLSPATLEAAETTAGFAVNRRNNRANDVAEMLQRGETPKGPSDHTVSVLAVRGPQGKLKAAVFGYSCHATALSVYQWSGDYPGFAQLAMERTHPGLQAMFYQACGGDQNPLPRGTVELCQKYGEQLATAVNRALEAPLRPIAPRLATAAEFVELKFKPLPPTAELEKLACGNNYRARWAKRMLALLETQRPLPTSYPYPIQAWKLGADQLWISLGGEPVVDYALMLKAKYGPRTWVNGYTSDLMAYVPSQRVWEEGGYEAGAFEASGGMPGSGWDSGIEQSVLAGIDRVVRKVQSNP